MKESTFGKREAIKVVPATEPLIEELDDSMDESCESSSRSDASSDEEEVIKPEPVKKRNRYHVTYNGHGTEYIYADTYAIVKIDTDVMALDFYNIIDDITKERVCIVTGVRKVEKSTLPHGGISLHGGAHRHASNSTTRRY